MPGSIVPQLPRDLLLRIVDYLSISALHQVCHEWREALPPTRLRVSLPVPDFHRGWNWLRGRLPALHTLHLRIQRQSGRPGAWDLASVIEGLAVAPHLEGLLLDLRGQGLQGALQPLESLASLPALKDLTLSLEANGLRQEDAEVLSRLRHCRQLQSLVLSLPRNLVGDAGCAALATLVEIPTLQFLTLNLQSNGCGSRGMAALAAVDCAPGLRQLKLNLAASAPVGGALSILVGACRSVEDLSLDLQGNQLGSLCLWALSTLSLESASELRLRTLAVNVENNGLQAGDGRHLSALGRITALTALTLELGFNALECADMEPLCALRGCHGLQRLHIGLQGNLLGPTGVAHLTRAALDLPALRDLRLSLFGQIGQTDRPDFAPQGVLELARLAQHTGLVRL
eukprot:EG_transcript_14447